MSLRKAQAFRYPCGTIPRFDREYKRPCTAVSDEVQVVNSAVAKTVQEENAEYKRKVSAPAESDAAIVLTTIGADVDAGPLARALVEERLAACVNVLPPMTSTYRWKGRVEQAQERQLIIKTSAGRIAALEARLRELHPYEVPEFLVLPVSAGSEAYLRWLREGVSPDRS
ncbi:MAG: divalent-cation tolerance protein CutA [Acidobacteria bacterium]|nr:divalent-cation tolerance protein CutA [Acidobacteriota bacterium]